ncbi:MAG: hypothetical protein R3B96_08870 [Pirellulaceae bacterium]
MGVSRPNASYNFNAAQSADKPKNPSLTLRVSFGFLTRLEWSTGTTREQQRQKVGGIGVLPLSAFRLVYECLRVWCGIGDEVAQRATNRQPTRLVIDPHERSVGQDVDHVDEE